jgi:hypothetical protein
MHLIFGALEKNPSKKYVRLQPGLPMLHLQHRNIAMQYKIYGYGLDTATKGAHHRPKSDKPAGVSRIRNRHRSFHAPA